ncbi:hypothetical protein QBC47DRAFT_391596 [Echria macrotheca]|uniref:Uncharacterized protein n=1 Tax=Echria macrotheca TaxID=438768 RepID=A0AAJ0B4Y2_9PEZI|nr:hypothetical protein QBC47DRAFT_391596 [Echria macrotheca]
MRSSTLKLGCLSPQSLDCSNCGTYPFHPQIIDDMDQIAETMESPSASPLAAQKIFESLPTRPNPDMGLSEHDGSVLLDEEQRPVSPKAAKETSDDVAASPENENLDSPTEIKKPPNRKTRNRERQRAKRALKRQSKRASEPVKSQSASDGAKEDKDKRHRPTQAERSMAFFMTMYKWSCIFVQRDNLLPYLTMGKKVDHETADIISRVIRECWLGDEQPLEFESVEQMEQFVNFKAKEAQYFEKQLALAPPLQDEVWTEYFAGLGKAEPQVSVKEALGGPADFLRDNILPCLKAQVDSLRARAVKARALCDKKEELSKKWDRQQHFRSEVQGLRRFQAHILPICPAWKEVGAEIARLRKEMLQPHDLQALYQSMKLKTEEYSSVLGRTTTKVV